MRTNYAETNDHKLLRIFRRHGILYLLRRIMYRLVIQPCIHYLAPKRFSFGDALLPYYRHTYNTTFINERAVEIPVFRQEMEKTDGAILEIGNVLGHYFPIHWDVVDKFEKFPGVINEDIQGYRPGKTYSLIIAISTFEHIGFDEEPRDPEKLSAVLDHIWSHLLDKGGKLLFSVPAGWNPELDNWLAQGADSRFRMRFFRRTSWLNTWKEDNLPVNPAHYHYEMLPHGLYLAEAIKN